MFVGHYSVAFAVRTEQNKIPLWVLFVAVQFLDYIWATLVLLALRNSVSSKASLLAACSTPIFTRIHTASSRRFFGAAWLACVTNYFAVGSATATQNQPPWSSASQYSRI